MIRTYFCFLYYNFSSDFCNKKYISTLCFTLGLLVNITLVCIHLCACVCVYVYVHSWSLAYISLCRSCIIRGRDKRYKLRTRDCQPVKSTRAEIPCPLLLVEFAEFSRDTFDIRNRVLRSRLKVFLTLKCEYIPAIGLCVDDSDVGFSSSILVVLNISDVSLSRRMRRVDITSSRWKSAARYLLCNSRVVVQSLVIVSGDSSHVRRTFSRE